MARQRARRNKETLELEAPWAGIRKQWADIDPAELQRRHAQAALLVAQGRAAIQWSRSHGEP